jgi:hypothetical protein
LTPGNNFTKIIDEVGGVEFKKSVSDLKLDLTNHNVLKEQMTGLLEGNFNIKGHLTGDENIYDVYSKVGQVGGIEI